MDALFRRSGLRRAKWDEVHYADGSTYGERTIERAVDMVDEGYDLEEESDGGGAGTPYSATSDEDSQGQEPPTASTRRDESVYLEERNRLLHEKAQSQAATIEQQNERIDELEQELQQAREQLTVEEEPDGDQPAAPGLWERVRRWLPGQ